MIKRGLKLDIVAEDKGVLNKLSFKVICIMSRKKNRLDTGGKPKGGA